MQQVNYYIHHLVINVPRIIRHNELMNMYLEAKTVPSYFSYHWHSCGALKIPKGILFHQNYPHSATKVVTAGSVKRDMPKPIFCIYHSDNLGFG